jgi:hypothetical protein
MAEGLLQMLGSGQQAQQQQQENLLGGLFQSESQARRQGRERLLGQALQIAQQQDPIGTGFAVAGGLLGEGIGRAMGRVTPEEARQQKFAGLQTQLMQEGLDPTQDPAGFYTRLSELLQNQGDMQTALRAAAKAREFAPEPVELPAEARTLAFQAQQAGLVPGTPEYKKFMQTGGEVYQGPEVQITRQDRPELSDPQISTIENIVESGNQARNIEFTLNAAADLAAKDDVPQDAFQPFITNLQGYAEAAGLNLEGALRRIGYDNIGDLSTKQELDRLYTELVIRGFDRFKGNLNDREVRLAVGAQPGLGKSREANLIAIATQQAAAEIAKRDSRTFLAASTPEEFRAALEERDNRSVEEFKSLRDQYYEQLTSQSQAQPTSTEGTNEFEGFKIRALD